MPSTRKHETVAPVEVRPVVQPVDDFVTIKVYALISGLTENAVRMKIKAGTWLEGREYKRAPDGSLWIDRHGVHRWIREGR